MRDERELNGPHESEGRTRPPRRGEYQLETPFYEEEFDPYFARQAEAPRTEEDLDQTVDPEDDWYWREPENYWLEEGIWPWPEPGQRKRPGPGSPSEFKP